MAGVSLRADAARGPKGAGRVGREHNPTEAGLDLLRVLGWLVLHEVGIPGDPPLTAHHLAAGPAGVFLITALEPDGAVELADGELRIGGVAPTESLARAAEAAAALSRLIEGRPVAPMLCVDSPAEVTAFAGDVAICSSENILDVLTGQAAVVDAATQARVARMLTETVQTGISPAVDVPVAAQPAKSRHFGLRRKRARESASTPESSAPEPMVSAPPAPEPTMVSAPAAPEPTVSAPSAPEPPMAAPEPKLAELAEGAQAAPAPVAPPARPAARAPAAPARKPAPEVIAAESKTAAGSEPEVSPAEGEVAEGEAVESQAAEAEAAEAAALAEQRRLAREREQMERELHHAAEQHSAEVRDHERRVAADREAAAVERERVDAERAAVAAEQARIVEERRRVVEERRRVEAAQAQALAERKRVLEERKLIEEARAEAEREIEAAARHAAELAAEERRAAERMAAQVAARAADGVTARAAGVRREAEPRQSYAERYGELQDEGRPERAGSGGGHRKRRRKAGPLIALVLVLALAAVAIPNASSWWERGRDWLGLGPAPAFGTTVDLAATTAHPAAQISAEEPIRTVATTGMRGSSVIAVQVRIFNGGDVKWTVPLSDRVSAVDSLGIKYGPARAVTEVEAGRVLTGSARVDPGSQVTGLVVFAIPKGRELDEFQLRPSANGGDALVWERR